MRIATGQVNNEYKKMPNNQVRHGLNSTSLNQRDNFHFTGNALAVIQQAPKKIRFNKHAGQITCNNANKLIGDLDELFGKGYFSSKVTDKIGNKIGASVNGDILTVKNRRFFQDEFWPTVRFPIYDLPLRAINGVYNATKAKKPEFLTNWLDSVETQKSKDFVLDVLEEFSGRKYGKEVDYAKHLADFQDDVTSNITKVKKNYASRDERSLNRMVTSIVSALYSASDFYNISMLEKDDKNEAKKAGRGRLRQDLTRMAFNTTTTFIALGMLDRYTKRNVFLNSLVIAGSALFSEISSRLISHTPLRVLTPNDAAKIAQKRKNKSEENKQVKANNNKNIPFKSSKINSDNVFSGFMNTNGNFTAIEVQNNQIAKETTLKKSPVSKKTNKHSIAKILAGATGIATIGFFGAKILKGDYRALKEEKEFLEKFGKNNTSQLTNEAKEAISNIQNRHSESIKKYSVWGKLKNFLTKKNTSVNLDELIEKLDGLKSSQDAEGMNSLIEKYEQHAQSYIDASNKHTFDTKIEIFGLAGVVNGFTKLFKTIYDLLTLPAKGASALIDKFTGNKEVHKRFSIAAQNIENNNPSKYKNELSGLYQILKKYDTKDPQSAHKAMDTIKKRVRNVELGSETGELANTSRTMVTAIGTYFFVNDYRNKVLIESEGKNVEGAKEETNERIMHKLFNFIINGTLMNVFNTTFKTTVNGSLLGAATVASATELTNEFLVRKSICQPVLPKASKQDIIDYEEERLNKKGIIGGWTRLFKKITGKKTLTQKAGIDTNNKQN